MTASFFFYDLETSGISPREARIMQFAGQRTDMNLEPVGDPVNILIKLSDDVLPDPTAILVTGITPQATMEGKTEAEFLKIIYDKVAIPGTIFGGYNSVRFDDEFMRYLNYRNFYDPYEWQWKEGRSRWDLLDVVRMTRALRPEGINWPVDAEGHPTNRLELMTGMNNLEHLEAHDALSDVMATVQVAKLLQDKQPKLFKYLLKMREKQSVSDLVLAGEPFVYTSGKYPSEYEKTTVAVAIEKTSDRQSAMVYDLRHDPTMFSEMSAKQLAECWRYHVEEDIPHLPIKTIKFNRCPAVAPLGVLDESSQERLKLNVKLINENHKKLKAINNWPALLHEARKIMDSEQEKRYAQKSKDVDSQLYDGFFDRDECTKIRLVPDMEAKELELDNLKFEDARLKKLLPLYKARNFPEALTENEYEAWEKHKIRKLLSGGHESQYAKFLEEIKRIRSADNLTDHQISLLDELEIYAESIMPEVVDV